MHQIEPFSNWLKYYDSSNDENSPFHGKEYNYELYSETIYGYYIDPAWDNFGSENLYLKILYADYDRGYTVLEFIGEWNDTLNNDIMTLKRDVLELVMYKGISKFILIGENVFNFHGSDDLYYEEWFEEVEDAGGWIAAVSFPDFIQQEMMRFKLDRFINMGGTLQIDNWRTLHPTRFCELIDTLIVRRLS